MDREAYSAVGSDQQTWPLAFWEGSYALLQLFFEVT